MEDGAQTQLASESMRQRDREFAAATLSLMANVKRYALFLARNDADADDIVQETYLRAHRYWDSFEAGSDCRKWLLTICRNVFTTSFHRSLRSVAVDDDELESMAAAQGHNAARAAGLDDMYSRLDLGPAINDAIAQLDPVFREVVVLSDVEGFSYDEIAQSIGIPVGTVRSRLFRARRHLQESLMNYAIDAGFARAVSAPRRDLPTKATDHG
jgi:RNA polymerase sigma-70 factor (ECF subfamily)